MKSLLRTYASATIAIYSILIFFTLHVSPVRAESKEVTVPSLPSSPEEFLQMRNELSRTPEGGAAMTIVSLMKMRDDRNMGLQFFTIALDRGNIQSGSVYRGYAPDNGIQYHIKRIGRRGPDAWKYLGYAYTLAGTPQNNYSATAPFSFRFSRNKYSGTEKEGQVKVFVEIDGFRPRPITMKKNTKGIWKAYGVSSLFLDVTPPASAQVKDEL